MFKLQREPKQTITRYSLWSRYIRNSITDCINYTKCYTFLFSPIPYLHVGVFTFCLTLLVTEAVRGVTRVELIVGSTVTILLGLIAILDIYTRIDRTRKLLRQFRRNRYKTYRKGYNMDKNRKNKYKHSL